MNDEDEDKILPIDLICRDCRARPYELCKHLTSYQRNSTIKNFHRARKQDARDMNRRARERSN